MRKSPLQHFQCLLLSGTYPNCILGHQHMHLATDKYPLSIPLMNLRDTVLGDTAECADDVRKRFR